MRQPVAGGADRTNDHRDRALGRRFCRSVLARLDGQGIVGAIPACLHATIEKHDSSSDFRSRCRRQFVQIGDPNDRRFDATSGRADATAQRGRRQRLRVGHRDTDFDFSALPMWHHDILGAHVLQAEFTHGCQRPGNRCLVAGRTRQPRADFHRQRSDMAKSIRRRQGQIAKFRRLAELFGGKHRGLLLVLGARSRGQTKQRRSQCQQHETSRPDQPFSGGCKDAHKIIRLHDKTAHCIQARLLWVSTDLKKYR